MDYTKYNQSQSSMSASAALDLGLRKYMIQVFNLMFAALMITGFVAYFSSTSEQILSLLYNVNAAGKITGMSGFGMLVAFAPLGFVLYFSFRVQSMSPDTAFAVFFIYAAVMGLSLTHIFLTYTGESVARVFFITASVFGVMSLYGYGTKKDLSQMGSILTMGLFAVIIASLANMFMKSSGLQFGLSIICVLIFTGLIAYDAQKLKSYYYNFASDSAMLRKSAIMGALSLYLDFINLFIQLLQLIGNRRD